MTVLWVCLYLHVSLIFGLRSSQHVRLRHALGQPWSENTDTLDIVSTREDGCYHIDSLGVTATGRTLREGDDGLGVQIH